MHPEYLAYSDHITRLLAHDATLTKYTYQGITIRHKPSGWHTGAYRFDSEAEAKCWIDGLTPYELAQLVVHGNILLSEGRGTGSDWVGKQIEAREQMMEEGK